MSNGGGGGGGMYPFHPGGYYVTRVMVADGVSTKISNGSLLPVEFTAKGGRAGFAVVPSQRREC